MDEGGDILLRNVTYKLFVDFGRAPIINDVAIAISSTVDDVWAGWERLHEGHALVLQEHAREIRMAAPFSAVPTAYRVFADRRWWYANCAWDAFGICAALHSDGRVETSCADGGAPITVEVRDELPDDDTLLYHCLVPAALWWDDIAFA